MDGIDQFGLVPGLRNDEIRRGIEHLLDKPFDWIVRNGYFVARGPQRDDFYEITAKGLEVVGGPTLEADDDLMGFTRRYNRYQSALRHPTQ
jgi:hypothetical protein